MRGEVVVFFSDLCLKKIKVLIERGIYVLASEYAKH